MQSLIYSIVIGRVMVIIEMSDGMHHDRSGLRLTLWQESGDIADN